MTNVTNLQVARRIALVFALCSPLACDSARAPSGLQSPATPSFGRTQSLTVTAANPSFGDQGQTNEAVTITGTGFDSTSQAAWLRNGVVDTTITVTSTKFVNVTGLSRYPATLILYASTLSRSSFEVVKTTTQVLHS